MTLIQQALQKLAEKRKEFNYERTGNELWWCNPQSKTFNCFIINIDALIFISEIVKSPLRIEGDLTVEKVHQSFADMVDRLEAE